MSEEPIVVMRPYPYIVCNATHPNHCKREPDGYCYLCHIPGFHADRTIPETEVKHGNET